jgi:hypothetical protein
LFSSIISVKILENIYKHTKYTESQILANHETRQGINKFVI